MALVQTGAWLPQEFLTELTKKHISNVVEFLPIVEVDPAALQSQDMPSLWDSAKFNFEQLDIQVLVVGMQFDQLLQTHMELRPAPVQRLH